MKRGWVLAALSLCVLLPSLGTSIANVALPTLAREFGVPFQPVQWVVLGYLMATTTLIVSAGRLGDLVGRRRLLVGGITVFTLASALCAEASGLWLLVAGRVAQGMGAAAMMALATALVGDAVPKARTGSAMGLLGTMSAVGTALGPSLGGVLIAAFGWPSIFWLNLPLGLAAALLAWRCLPAGRRMPAQGRSSFDPAGTLLLASTLAAYALAMTLGRGSFGPRNLALLAAAAVGLGLFVWVEGRVAAPLIRRSSLRDPMLGTGLALGGLVSTVVMATLVVGPFHLARGLGLATAQVGLAMSAGPLVSALAGVPAGRMVDRWGAPCMSLAGMAGMALGCVLLSLIPRSWGVAGYVGPLTVLTAGYALFQAANNTAVMADVPPERRGAISGLVNLSRNLGLITGVSVMGGLFSAAAGTADLASAPPDAVAHALHTTFAAAAVLVALGLVLAAARPARCPLPRWR